MASPTIQSALRPCPARDRLNAALHLGLEWHVARACHACHSPAARQQMSSAGQILLFGCTSGYLGCCSGLVCSCIKWREWWESGRGCGHARPTAFRSVHRGGVYLDTTCAALWETLIRATLELPRFPRTPAVAAGGWPAVCAGKCVRDGRS